jgi:hypothetical protein
MKIRFVVGMSKVLKNHKPAITHNILLDSGKNALENYARNP